MNYYKDMCERFQDAVNVIKDYCQFEDCDIVDCKDCPYPLSTIRCGDFKPVKLDELKARLNL